MKRFKITKKYFSPDANDFLYKVLEREFLFFWSHLSSHGTLEKANHYIASLLESEEREKRRMTSTPKEETVAYL